MPDGDVDIVVDIVAAIDRTCRRTRCQQWLEALRLATNAETCVIHRVMLLLRISGLLSLPQQSNGFLTARVVVPQRTQQQQHQQQHQHPQVHQTTMQSVMPFGQSSLRM